MVEFLQSWKLDAGKYILYPYVILIYIIALALIIGGAYFL